MEKDSPLAFPRLLDLPGELREMILAHAARSDFAIAPRVSIPRDAYVLRLPALAAVSRQIRRESLPLYFEENEFQFNVKDVLERPLQQDLRYEKKLLTFGAWCEAVGLERFRRIRKFTFVTSSALHAPMVTVELDGRGQTKVEIRCFWQGSRSRRPRGEVKNAPLSLVDVVQRAVETRQAGGLLPEDVMLLCRQIQRCGSDLLYSK